jgi:hypothetical protein
MKNNPVTEIILPYFSCILLIPFILNLIVDINYFILLLGSILAFHPYWNYLVNKWLREIHKTDLSESEIEKIIAKYGLKC